MPNRGPDTPRDPAAEKARDLKRQRKIAANSSDKAARRHARTIKAMENRKIRRGDRQALDETLEDSADQLNIDHMRKHRHWGSDNAAERRDGQADRQAHFREVGGRDAAQTLKWQEMRDSIDNEQVLKLINETLSRLAAKKKPKG
ncbi:MAG: hypothetical protein AB8B82_00425 [Roseovarius sp.]